MFCASAVVAGWDGWAWKELHKGAGAAFSFLFCLCTSWEHGAAPDAKYFLRNQGVWGWHWGDGTQSVPSTARGRLELGFILSSSAPQPSRAAHSLISLGIKRSLGFWEVVATNSVSFFIFFWGGGSCGKLPALLSPAQHPHFFSPMEKPIYPALVLIQREEFPAVFMSCPFLSPPSWEKQEFQEPGGC